MDRAGPLLQGRKPGGTPKEMMATGRRSRHLGVLGEVALTQPWWPLHRGSPHPTPPKSMGRWCRAVASPEEQRQALEASPYAVSEATLHRRTPLPRQFRTNLLTGTLTRTGANPTPTLFPGNSSKDDPSRGGGGGQASSMSYEAVTNEQRQEGIGRWKLSRDPRQHDPYPLSRDHAVSAMLGGGGNQVAGTKLGNRAVPLKTSVLQFGAQVADAPTR